MSSCVADCVRLPWLPWALLALRIRRGSILKRLRETTKGRGVRIPGVTPTNDERSHWSRLEEILDEVLELSAEDRPGRLQDLCGEDEELRAEIEALLAADAAQSGVLEMPVGDYAAALLEETREGLAGMPNPQLGPYRLIRSIGHGGMGVVYEARDPRLDRSVAIKLLPRAWSLDAAAKERFLREAQTASALDHPNICTVHDVGESDDGRLYIVMAYYAGETLAQRLEGGPLEVLEARRVTIEIARGLERAHKVGIVHRDVKPANVMLTEHDEVKILDFGIAKMAGRVGMTRTGTSPGTPAYMSPEQARGEVVDQRTDIWSLGAIFYEMLAGRRPFTADHEAGMIHAIVHEQPEPLARIRPEVDADLQHVAARMLEKDRDDRYAGLADVLMDLGASRESGASVMVDRSPLAAGTPPPSTPAVFGLRRFVAGAVAAGFAAGAILLQSLRDPVAAPPSDGSETVETLTESEVVSAGEIVPHTAYLTGRELLSHGYRRGNPQKAIKIFEQVLAVDDRHAPSYAGLAYAYLWRFNQEEDPLLLERAHENAELAVESNGQLAVARVRLAFTLTLKGEHQEAMVHLEEALRLDPLSAEAHRELGSLQLAMGHPGRAKASYETALELRAEDWLAHERLGLLAYREGDYATAEAELTRASEMVPDNASLTKNLAAVFLRQSRFEEAAAQLQRSLEAEPLPSTYTNLGALQFQLGRYRRARHSFEQAITLGANHYLHWANLADALRWTGAKEEAQERYLRAIQLLRERLAAAPDDATLRSRLALYLAKRGQTVEALAEVESLGAPGIEDANAWFRLTVVYELAGARPSALEALRAALAAEYSPDEIRREPELTELRKDPAYHRLVAPFVERAENGRP